MSDRHDPTPVQCSPGRVRRARPFDPEDERAPVAVWAPTAPPLDPTPRPGGARPRPLTPPTKGSARISQQTHQLAQFWQVPKELLANPDLSAHAKLLWAVLWGYSGRKQGVAYPRIGTLARDLGVSRRSVNRYVRELRDAGMIEVRSRRGSSNVFAVLEHPSVFAGRRV